ncbi:tyrosine-type recombinase/integrase [Nonomuraea sp. ATR24]
MAADDVNQQQHLRAPIPLDHHGQEQLHALAHPYLSAPLPESGADAPAQTLDELSHLLWRTRLPVREATVQWLSDGPLSAATRRRYLRLISWWLWWSNRRRLRPEEGTVLDADLFAAAMRAAQWSDNARRQHLTALSSWYGYLCRLGLTSHNPFAGVRRPASPSARIPLLSPEQLIDLLAHAVLHESSRLQAILLVVITADCDPAHAASLSLRDLVRAGRDRIVDLPAAGGPYAVLLPPLAAQVLDAYLITRGTHPGPLFLTRTGAPLVVNDANRQIRRVARTAGIKHAAPLTLELIRRSADAAHPGNRRRRRATPAIPTFPHPVYHSGEIRLCQRLATEIARRRIPPTGRLRRSTTADP